MDLTVPAELDALCRTVRAFVEREVDPVIPEIEETDRVPEAVLAKAREVGLFGMGIPEEYGGLGLGVLGRALFYEVLDRGGIRLHPLRARWHRDERDRRAGHPAPDTAKFPPRT